jgi:hypothetical protein
MRKVLALFGVGALLSCVTGCALQHAAALLHGGSENSVKGSGNRKTEDRTVGEFDRIEAGGATDLQVKVGATQKVTVEYDDNLLPLLTSTVKDGTLVIETKGNINSHEGPKITITVPKLNGLDLSGATQGKVTDLRSKTLDIKLSGAASIEASGVADKLDLNISGAGRAELKKLNNKTAKVDVSGAGNAALNTTDSLTATVSGAGSVNYVHAPKSLQKDVSGAGSIGPL